MVGTLSRYHLLRPRRKQVILMDHNEKAQSVPGLDQAEILEIIDHHRLADIQTKNPITVRNEPVGSTTTIVAGMYQDKGLMPTAKMAGLMAAAIVSDTVMFKSPTCTQRDIDVANRMARIANISQITFDSLPHNSAIVLTLSYCGVTHKEGYKHLFVVTVVTTTLATIVNIIMAHLGVI